MNKTQGSSNQIISLNRSWEIYSSLHQRLVSTVFGRENDGGAAPGTIPLILLGMFADGHVLLEDYPGSGKSFISEQLGNGIDDDIQEMVVPINGYNRIQCTPDLLPQDLVGFSMFDKNTEKFKFSPGPIFAHVLLVDEINRTTPKVQSALLSAMAERHVTVDGQRCDLGDVFFTIATQNPLDQAGTYPLPAASLDRFLFKRRLRPIDPKYEAGIMLIDSPASLLKWREQQPDSAAPEQGSSSTTPPAKVKVSEIAAAQHSISHHCQVDPLLVNTILELSQIIDSNIGTAHAGARITGGNIRLSPGSRPSARALRWLVASLKVLAFMKVGMASDGSFDERNPPTATVELLPELAPDFLRHRIIPASNVSGEELDEFIRSLAKEACARVIER
jgi:hypothetical protein